MRFFETRVHAMKRKDGKIVTVGDEVKLNYSSYAIVRGKRSRRKNRVCGFEKHSKGYYILYFPQYSNGSIEKKNPWRIADLDSKGITIIPR